MKMEPLLDEISVLFRELECVDINECESDNGGCAQLCVNSPGAFSCQCHSEYYLNVTTKECDFRLHKQISDEHFFLIFTYTSDDVREPYRIYHEYKRPVGPIWGAPGRPGWDLSLVGDEFWRSEEQIRNFHINPKTGEAFIILESKVLYSVSENEAMVLKLI